MSFLTSMEQGQMGILGDVPSASKPRTPSEFVSQAPAPETYAATRNLGISEAPSVGSIGQPKEEPSKFNQWLRSELGSIASSDTSLGDYVQAGVETVGELADTQAGLAQDKRAKDLQRWKEDGKWWFDPDADVDQQLNEYLSEMPTATGALEEGLLIGGIHNENEVAGYFLNPIAAIATKAGADPNMASYVSEQGGYGALEGFASSGWIGAIVGGLVGTLKGVFGWEAAVEEDKEARKRARTEYERRMKMWQAARTRRINEQQLAYESKRKQEGIIRRAGLEVKQERKKKERLATAKEQRKAIINALTRAEKAGSSLRTARLGRWQ